MLTYQVKYAGKKGSRFVVRLIRLSRYSTIKRYVRHLNAIISNSLLENFAIEGIVQLFVVLQIQTILEVGWTLFGFINPYKIGQSLMEYDWLYSGTLLIGPLLGQEKGGQISEVVTLSRWFKHSKTKTGRLKSGLFVKVVWLSRWSHFKVPLYQGYLLPVNYILPPSAQLPSNVSIILAKWSTILKYYRFPVTKVRQILTPVAKILNSTHHYQPKSREIMYLVAPIRLSIRYHSPGWTIWPTTFMFCMEVDLDPGKAGHVVQDRRSRVKVKQRVNVFWLHCLSLITLFWDRGQRSRSRSNSWCVAVDIRGSACQVQQKTITLKFWARSTSTSPSTLSVSL